MCEGARARAGLIGLTELDRRALVRGLAGGTLALLAPGCVTNAETGRRQLLTVDPATLREMAVAAWAEAKATTPVSRDAKLQRRLSEVGRRVQQGAGRGGEPWEFAVFDTEDVNAFVLPGGKVGAYRGLLALTENDDQLAAVLGHEAGHVTANHAGERASQSRLAEWGYAVGGVALSGQVYAQAAQTVFGLGVQYGVLMPYSRLQELEADKLGVDYMHRAGYRPREAVRLWELMAARGGARKQEMLSTHPDPARRMAELNAYIARRGYDAA